MKKYLPYGDSPTIKSYTRWDRFEKVLQTVSDPELKGVEESAVAPVTDDLWWTAEHFKRARGFKAQEKFVFVSSTGGMGFAHIEVPLRERVLIFENSERGPLSVSGRITGRGEVFHIIRGKHPHFSLWEIRGDVTIRTLVEGTDTFLRYRGKDNITAYGLSKGGRSDVFHVFEARSSTIINRHALLGEEDSFLVHRPLARVYKDGDAFLETLLIKQGGFVTGVPSVEVYSAQAKGARHSVKDLVPTEEQLFYLRSRGFGKKEAEEYLIEEAIRFLLGDLLKVGMSLL